MIVKKVKNPKKSSSKRVRITRLANYIRQPESENSLEKCVYFAARGFITEESRSQTAEMLALAQEAVRSKDTINHYVLSWQVGERPESEQIEEAVDIFLNQLGLIDHQVIYGLHADTDNIHLHIAVNRVHPENLKCIEINGGFDIEAAHKAIARIEHAQGWRSEANSRYQVLENGDLGRDYRQFETPPQPDQPKRDMEMRSGEKSAERIAIENVAPLIARAMTWRQLHEELAAIGVRYERKGSGAIIIVGEVAVKASSAHRDASLSKLQMRLGFYEPLSNVELVMSRVPEPIKSNQQSWAEYTAGRKAHYSERARVKMELDMRLEGERKRLTMLHRARRAERLNGNWRGKGHQLNATRSIIAAEQAAERAALRDRHRHERKRFRDRFRPYPDLTQWLAVVGRPIRNDSLSRIQGDWFDTPIISDIRSFVPQSVGGLVRYSRVYADSTALAFVDRGRCIDMFDECEDAVLAALQLASQKWGSVMLTGSDEFKILGAHLAVQHGFNIKNPELQQMIEDEKIRLWGSPGNISSVGAIKESVATIEHQSGTSPATDCDWAAS